MQPIHINLIKSQFFGKENKKEGAYQQDQICNSKKKTKWYARLGVGLYSAFKGAPY